MRKTKAIAWLSVIGGLTVMMAACTNNNGAGVIRISGNIEMTEVKVAFKISGKLVERNADEGDLVEKGDVIARLDSEQLLRQRDEAAAVLTAAQSGLRQLLTAIDLQRETLEGQVAERKAQLRDLSAQLAALEAGSRKQEIRQSRARVEQAETEFQQAEADWKRARSLYQSDDISRAQYDQFEARYRASQAQLEQARQMLALVEEGPRKQTIESARARVEQARAAVRLAEAQRLELKRKQQEVDTRRAEIARARARLALVESQLDDAVAVAPVSGIVLSKSAEVGEVLAAGTPVLTIGDLERPWLRGYINEQDLGRVKIGSKARVTTDSFPGKVYPGTVSFISSEAEFTPKQIQTEEERVKLVYRIKIDVENPNQELKLNMPVEAEILASGDRAAEGG